MSYKLWEKNRHWRDMPELYQVYSILDGEDNSKLKHGKNQNANYYFWLHQLKELAKKGKKK